MGNIRKQAIIRQLIEESEKRTSAIFEDMEKMVKTIRENLDGKFPPPTITDIAIQSEQIYAQRLKAEEILRTILKSFYL